ncbi:MAG: FAD-linked oxidase C-terminal domain-containing protein [Chloroflexota bacterium]
MNNMIETENDKHLHFQQKLKQSIQGGVSFDRFSRAMHATDASVYQILPTGVVTPTSVEDVVETIRLCHEYGVSITARGGGTSQAGQAIGEGISLDFSKHMNRLLELNVAEGGMSTVVVEPGMVLDELNAILKPYGLQLPLDLSTSNRATIGGMIANNSAGTRSIIYGKTLDYVEELDIVLADGTLVQMGPLEPASLAEKTAQEDIEGVLYQMVQQLAHEHKDEIEQRYPKILRRVGGYNLDEFVPNKVNRPFNLVRIMVGSEGTLGMTVKAKLRVVPLPKERVVCCVQFEDILEAMKATPIILEHNPSAVELVDRFILDTTRGRVEFEPLRDFIVGDPDAVLLVEFFGDTLDELPERIDRLEADLQSHGLGHYVYRAVEPSAQTRIWTLRKAALGLTMSVKGTDAKGISFVEDTAVAPENLRGYIENFQRILAKYDTQAGFYAHASVGLLHIRPMVNMKTAEGVQRFEAIANEVADLVVEYEGALSGEHGDGLVRTPFQEKLFGPVLYEAFRQLKSTFDPSNLFNPGKIVDAPELTSNLRFGVDYETPDIPTAYDFSDFGGLLRATEQCSGVGVCRKTLTGTMCPSYMATRNEIDSTRGRANALRQALVGDIDSIGLADEELKPVMDLCLECKACKSECPTGVDMARLKSEFMYQYRFVHGTPLREQILARMEQISIWGSRLAPFSNWLVDQPIIRWLNEQLLGIDRRRPLPHFAANPFTSQTHPMPDSPTVVLFADTFNNYYEPDHLTAAVRVLEYMGAQVAIAPRVCCGRPLISKGFLDQAAKQAQATTQALLPLVEQELPILFCEPSCYSAVKDDHPLLLWEEAQEDAQKVADACLLVEEWQPETTFNIQFDAQAKPHNVHVHGHCHQKALVGMDSLMGMFNHVLADNDVTAINSGCCGLAGLYGYEHYDISEAIGEQRLLPAVRALAQDDVVVSPGFSCRQQIKHFTGRQAHSPMSYLASLIEGQ